MEKPRTPRSLALHALFLLPQSKIPALDLGCVPLLQDLRSVEFRGSHLEDDLDRSNLSHLVGRGSAIPAPVRIHVDKGAPVVIHSADYRFPAAAVAVLLEFAAGETEGHPL